MADQKISALTEDTTPDRTLDMVPIFDASGNDNNKVALQNVGAYTLQASFGPLLSPADATTYYFAPSLVGTLLVNVNHKLRIPRAGVIRKIYIDGNCTTGTSETSTISLRLNDTTDTTIVTTLALNTAPFAFSNTAMTVTVAAGDYVNIKWVTPTWVTNPTNVTMYAVIWIA